MGWKAFRDHFAIRHLLSVSQGRVQIGSAYVERLVSIDPATGDFQEDEVALGFVRRHYPALADAAPELIRDLLQAPDVFDQSIPVYVFQNYEIVEKYCETPGWPNLTHDGEVMYDNEFSRDRATVEAWARENLRCRVTYEIELIGRLERELQEARDAHARSVRCLERMDSALS